MSNLGRKQQDVRQANRELVFRLFRRHKILSCTELAEKTGLSNAGAEKIIDGLYENGYVRLAAAPPRTSKGRRPIFYEINPDAGVITAFNFTDSEWYVLDLCGNELFAEPLEAGTVTESSVQKIITRTLEVLAGFDAPHICCLVALVGKSDKGTGKVVYSKRFTEGLELKKLLSEGLNVPVSIENDTYLMLAAEGDKRDLNDCVYMYIGKGISCAFRLAGKMYHGVQGLAGELGGLKFNYGGGLEQTLDFDTLKKSDAYLVTDKSGYDFATLERLAAYMARTAVLLDLDEIILGCPFPEVAAFLGKKLTQSAKTMNAHRLKVNVINMPKADDGLKLTAAATAHSVIIESIR